MNISTVCVHNHVRLRILNFGFDFHRIHNRLTGYVADREETRVKWNGNKKPTHMYVYVNEIHMNLMIEKKNNRTKTTEKN